MYSMQVWESGQGGEEETDGGRGRTYCSASKMHYKCNAAVQTTLTNEGNWKCSTHPKYQIEKEHHIFQTT